MCKIAEAANEMSAGMPTEIATPAETAVEEAIVLLDYIQHAFTRLESDIRDVELCMRRYAVLAPLYKDYQTTAKAVFGRQWLNPKKAEEIECRDQLAAVINNPESRKPDADFAEVLLKSRCLLEKSDGHAQAILLQAAETVCQQLQAKSASASVHQLPPKSHRKIDVLPAVVDVETLTLR